MVGRYHVVCHECPFEKLYEDRSIAERQRDAHEATNGHRLSLLDISERQVPEPSQ